MDTTCLTCFPALCPAGRRAEHAAQPICRLCKARRGVFGRAPAMAGAPGGPPTQRSPRPKAPEVEFSGSEVSITIGRSEELLSSADRAFAGDEAPVSSEPEPLSLRDVDVLSSPLREVTASRRLFDLISLSDGPDGEPVSLSDLQAVFSPGFNPSPRLGPLAPPAVTPTRVVFDEEPHGDAAPMPLLGKRRAPAVELTASPESSPGEPVSSGSILEIEEPEPAVDVDFSGIDETRPSPGVEKKAAAKKDAEHHALFRVSDAPPAGSFDLFAAEPAPFDASVPPLPPSAVPRSESPDSGLLDIRAMAEHEFRKDKAAEEPKRTDFDLFNLSGGLFDEAPGDLGPPDLGLIAAPRASTPPRSSSPPVSRPPIAPVLSPSSAPVVSERHPRPAGSTRRVSRAAVAIGLCALVALGAVGVSRLRSSQAERSEPAPPGLETTALTGAAPPLLPAPPRTAELPVNEAPPPEKSPPVVATASAPRPAPSTPATPTTSPTRDTPPPVVEKPPAPEKTVPAVEKPPPAPVVEAPPPAAGAEFDKGAAKAALASAASRASGCKPADDPGGGAKVSVTFAPSGRVTSSRVTGPPYQGTTIGGCIAAAFRGASVPPFDGAPVTVSRDVNLH